MANSCTFSINFMGDVMLGRLVDQLFSINVDCPEEARLVESMRHKLPHSKGYGPESPWGNALPLIRSGDLNIINLETSVTTHSTKWPNKVFNYQMHPDNIEALKAACIDYVSLANNHTLDFGVTGLLETVRTVRDAGIKFAGAGETRNEAAGPVQLVLQSRLFTTAHSTISLPRHHIYAYSFSDHPRDWASVPQFNFIDYTEPSRRRLQKELQNKESEPALKIVSIHWGPNYCWSPSAEIKTLAHFLVDECGVDLIHGHSSHHIQGVEIYNGKLIMYGCGDFLDDYVVVPGEWRNDLSALWRVTVAENDRGLKLKTLEIFPNRIKDFQAGLLDRSDPDHKVIAKRFGELCAEMGTVLEEDLGTDGQLVIKVSFVSW